MTLTEQDRQSGADAVVILGSKPDVATWEFPSHIYKALDEAADLCAAGYVSWAVVSGKWTLTFDKHDVRQPFRECDKMADFLVSRGISDDRILREGESKDTISNLFYLKRQIFEPHQLKRLLFVVADFRRARIEYLVEKVLGPTYDVSFRIVLSKEQERYPHERKTFERTRAFLADMVDGDDTFLEGKFYSAEYYR